MFLIVQVRQISKKADHIWSKLKSPTLRSGQVFRIAPFTRSVLKKFTRSVKSQTIVWKFGFWCIMTKFGG